MADGFVWHLAVDDGSGGVALMPLEQPQVAGQVTDPSSG